PSIFAADDMFELGNGESGRFFIFTHWPSGQIEISLENALDWIQKGTREIQADQEKPALLSNIPWYSLEYFLKQHENEIFFTHGPNSLPWTLSTHHALLGTSGKLSYLVSKATLGDQTFDLVFKPLSMARLDLQFEFRHCLDLNHKEKHVRQSSFSYDFELLKDRVLVAEYLFGGKTPLSKTFFLIVNWPTQEVELWVESKNGKGKSKIERQALTHLRDSCRQKMSSDFH
ncbi:MAG: hypothetical protein KDD35_03920, partial [Bdellovibrionales bacterium]|nr:hypothetical protein [Bdellovibrionales bacterium]